MLIGKFKIAAVVGAIGLASTLFTYTKLVAERGAHADTRQSFVEYREQVADLSISRAEHVAEQMAYIQEQIDSYVQNEMVLRRELRQLQTERADDRRESDARIEELKRENEQLARWAATAIPGPWIDFMREPIADAPAGHSRGDSGQVSLDAE